MRDDTYNLSPKCFAKSMATFIFAANTKRSMGKLMLLYCFILSVFPADAGENRRHIHIVRRGRKNAHRGDTVAKIWIEENGLKKIEIAWSELSVDEEALVIKTIDQHWSELNKMIDDVFAGKR
jgi:LPS sulfotransferase NodH